MDDKLKRRLQKLLNLAERGVDGEKETAQRMLDKTLAVNGLTVEDITADEKSTVWFRYQVGPHRKELLFQIAATICGYNVQVCSNKNKQRQLGVECTEYERIQIELSHKIYERAFKKEIELAFKAFVDVNNLYPSDVPDSHEFSQEEKADYWEAEKRASNMSATPVYQALENKRK